MLKSKPFFYFVLLLYFWGFLLLSPSAKSQVLYDTGQIALEITTIINAMPIDTAGDDYIPPSALQLSTFTNALSLIHSNQLAAAADSLATLNYSLTQYFDTGEVVHENLIFLQNTGLNFWGTYIFNLNYCKPLVIQSPHPKFDFNTGKQGIYVYRKTDAYAFMMSGTHRCNSSVYTACTGSTDVCAAVTEDYRISDMAHYDSSIFHFTTRNLFDQFSNTVFVQLHGFTKGGSDPYVIMSNGTRKTPLVDYLDTLDGALYVEDTVLTFKLMHIDTTWTKLAGQVNVQGRYINQSSNPCNVNPTSTTGRFLHLEQEKDRLRANATGWAKMANALNNVFACAALPVQLLRFTGERQNAHVFLEWKTASEHRNHAFRLEKLNDKGIWTHISTLAGAGNSNEIKYYSYLDENVSNRVLYYRLIQVDEDGHAQIAGIIEVNGEPLPEFNVYPNPASKMLHVQFNNALPLNLRIYSPEGKLCIFRIIQPGETTLDISTLKPGLYLIDCQQGNETYHRKLMIGPGSN